VVTHGALADFVARDEAEPLLVPSLAFAIAQLCSSVSMLMCGPACGRDSRRVGSHSVADCSAAPQRAHIGKPAAVRAVNVVAARAASPVSRVVCCMLRVACCTLRVACCTLRVACCALRVARRLSRVVRGALRRARTASEVGDVQHHVPEPVDPRGARVLRPHHTPIPIGTASRATAVSHAARRRIRLENRGRWHGSERCSSPARSGHAVQNVSACYAVRSAP
jgi:hypothetical protein